MPDLYVYLLLLLSYLEFKQEGTKAQEQYT